MARCSHKRSHNCFHITSKRGVYHYRRRLPGTRDGEVCLSLSTRQFREAEHRAALLDGVFEDALRRAKVQVSETTDLNAILRKYLRDGLKRDLEMHLDRSPGSPVYAHWWEPGDKQTAVEADLRAIRDARDKLKLELAENSPKEMADGAEELIQKHALPQELRAALTIGLIEAAIRSWDVPERRTLGTEPLVFEAGAEATTGAPILAGKATSTAASNLIHAFGAWGVQSGGWRAGGEGQAVTSLQLFIEVCGDKPIDSYTRMDSDKFRAKLRQLPAVYRKSAKDTLKPLDEIIAEAEAKGLAKITDKTVKRHIWGSPFPSLAAYSGTPAPAVRRPRYPCRLE